MQQPQNISGKTEINKSGQEFFHSVYYGVIAGFKAKSKENSLLNPSFEFSFYPVFVTLDSKRVNMGMFSDQFNYRVGGIKSFLLSFIHGNGNTTTPLTARRVI